MSPTAEELDAVLDADIASTREAVETFLGRDPNEFKEVDLRRLAWGRYTTTNTFESAERTDLMELGLPPALKGILLTQQKAKASAVAASTAGAGTSDQKMVQLLEELVVVGKQTLRIQQTEYKAISQLPRSKASTQAEDQLLKSKFIEQVLGGLTEASYQLKGCKYYFKTVTCEVLGIKIPISMTKLAHLWPYKRRHESDVVFKFKNINCNRNLMVTYRAIEEWFDNKQLTLVCGKGTDPYTLELLHLADSSMAEELFVAKYAYSHREGTQLKPQQLAELKYARSVCAGELAKKLGKPDKVQPKLQDLHKMQVVFQRTKDEDRPFRRVLWALSHEAAEAAASLGWITEQNPLSALVLQLAEHGSPGSDMATVRAWFLTQPPTTFVADADGVVDVPAESEESLEFSGSFAG